MKTKDELIAWLRECSEIKIFADYCQEAPEGNMEKECSDDIRAKIKEDPDHVWYWCDVKVSVWAPFPINLSESDHLSQCSYADESDFKAGGYYTDMVDQCLATLADRIIAIRDASL